MLRSSEIQKAVIDNEPIEGIDEPTDTLNLGIHKLPISEEIVELDFEHSVQIERLILDGLSRFPREETRVQDAIGQPTIIARVDCTIGANGIMPFECEERPAGFGVLNLMHQRHSGEGIEDLVQSHAVETLGSGLVVVRHPDAFPSDDAALFEVHDSVENLNGHAVIVRGEPHMFSDERAYRELAARSASTIRSEGDKTYTLDSPHFDTRIINAPDTREPVDVLLEDDSESELPSPDESFVLKTIQGSKCQGISIYLSSSDRKVHGKKGTISYSKARNIVAGSREPILVESFKPAIKTSRNGNMILRVIALVSKDNAQVIGGAFMTRPEMLVHGASNAVAGLIVVAGEGK
jgi:hypothetical protein